ncbi:hypothetical protein V6N13_009676 [Hibiscus sabdariffa]
MESFGAQMAKRNAMWLYPKVSGFNPSERWGHSACYSNGTVYVFGFVWFLVSLSVIGKIMTVTRSCYFVTIQGLGLLGSFCSMISERTTGIELFNVVLLYIEPQLLNLGCCGGLHFSDVLMLNLNTMVWRTLETTGQGPGPRDSHSVVLVRGKMMVFGGTNGSKKVNDLHILDLTSKEWIQAECYGTVPSPRESHTATLIGEDKVVIFGGSGEGRANYLNDLHVLDLRTMRWTSPQVRGHIPVPRDSHSAVAIGNKLIVYGGDCGDRYHGDVDIFNMDTSTWSRLAVQGSLPGVRAGHAAVNVGAKVFIIGGVGDKHYYNDVWVLDVNACCWTQLDICGQQPRGRFSHTAVLAESDIAIYGGCGEDERPINELLVLQLGAQHPNGRYNISMCKTFGVHWNQEKRRFLRVAPNNEPDQEAMHSWFNSDTSNPKRRRTANAKTWEVESEQEEHSLSLSQHSSSSHSDQEQGPALKPPDSTASQGLNLFKQFHPIPSKCQLNNGSNNHKQTRYMVHKTREDLQYTREFRNLQKPEQYLQAVNTSRQRIGPQCSAVEQIYLEAGPIPNLLGADVCGKVDGAFDSGLLMTATVNGKIFRGVLFAPGSSGFVSRGPKAGAAQPFLNSQPPTTTCIMPESGNGSRHLVTNATSVTAKDPKVGNDVGDVVLTLGGPGTGPV